MMRIGLIETCGVPGNDNKQELNQTEYVVLFMYCTIKVKVKVKFTPEQATKAQRGSGGRAILFL
jgi:hypothetical protein